MLDSPVIRTMLSAFIANGGDCLPQQRKWPKPLKKL